MFVDLAARGKTSGDWFFGFKLHLVVNEQGELLNLTLTPGNTDDRKPVPRLLQALFGKGFADRGYVSQRLAQQLLLALWHRVFCQAYAKYEKLLDAAHRQVAHSQTSHH